MKALLGDYPVTKLFKEQASLEFADVNVPNTAFKRVMNLICRKARIGYRLAW